MGPALLGWRHLRSRDDPALGMMVYWVAQIVAYGVGAMSFKLFMFGLLIKLAVTAGLGREIVMAVFAASRLRAQGVEIVSPTELPAARARGRQLGAASEKR